jgi:hypothetical protein
MADVQVLFTPEDLVELDDVWMVEFLHQLNLTEREVQVDHERPVDLVEFYVLHCEPVRAAFVWWVVMGGLVVD